METKDVQTLGPSELCTIPMLLVKFTSCADLCAANLATEATWHGCFGLPRAPFYPLSCRQNLCSNLDQALIPVIQVRNATCQGPDTHFQ